MRAIVPTLAVLLIVAGCGDDGDPGAPDAALDAGRDAGRDSGFDAGPVCSEPCGAGQACCPGDDGEPICVSTRHDVRHCGGCGIDCLESGRGMECMSGLCVCGSSTVGCPGGTVCCPPRPEGTQPYCARFSSDPDDCGSCGFSCDRERSDHCNGGRCLCGEGSRRQCDGTPEDTCCSDVAEMSECVDTTSDRRHCGGCGNGCDPGSSCVDGECEVT